MNAMQLPIEQRVERFKQYYRRANERPLLGFFVGSDYPLHRYPASRSLPVDRPLRPDDFDIELYLDDCDRLFEQHEACGGDFIFRMRLAVEFIQRMAKRSTGRWPIGTTRMRGIADLLSALYGGGDFIFPMMDKSDEIHAVASKLTDLWIAFGRLQLELIPLFHGGVGSFYYHLWAPAGTVWHQEDAAALLSPALYDQFIRQHDERIVAAFDHVIMHQHPTRFVPTDFYLKMNFTALELHVDQGGPSAEALYGTHLKIMAKTPLLIWGNLTSNDLDWIFSKLPPKGLAVMTVVEGPQQAAQIWDTYMGVRYSHFR